MNLAGEELSNQYKPAIWLAGSASAEVFADIALCPFEMTKVKIQTSPSGTFPTAFGAALSEMRKNKIETRYPFGSLVPLWSRQVSTCRLDRVVCDSIRPRSFRFPTRWPSSSSLRRSCNHSTRTTSRSPKRVTPRRLSSVLPLPLVTLLVSFVPSYHILLIRSCRSWANLRTRARVSVRLHRRRAQLPLPPRVSVLV